MGAGFQWTDEPQARLKELFDQGKSDSVMARMLSEEFGTVITRNAVIGRRARTGLQHDEHTIASRMARKQMIAKRAGGARNGAMLRKIRTTITAPQSAVGDVVARRIQAVAAARELRRDEAPPTFACTTAVSFADLEDHHCRWPVGNMYCGGALWNKHRSSYCAQHDRAAARTAWTA